MHSLTRRIMIGLAAGFLFGLVLNQVGPGGFTETWIVNGGLDVGGRIFVALLKLLVVPLVFVSLVVGAASLHDIRKVGRIGVKTLGLYLLTTALGVTLAISVATIVKPGFGFGLDTNATYQAKDAPPLSDVLVNIIPTNPIQALAQGEMLQIIFFAILLGLGLVSTGKSGERLIEIFRDLDKVMMKLVMVLIEAAPYGVFCLIARVFATQGYSAIVPLAKYFVLVLFVLALQAFGVYPLLLKLFSGLNPITFFRKFKAVPAFAFSTSSSNATLPVTLENATLKLGVSHTIASFTLPLGATINMDGTAIMQGVATVFIAQAYGIDIGMSGYVTVVATATLASIGTAGVPGVGLITLAMVLRQVNLPVEGIALIIGVDRLLDMARTVVNVMGDAAVTCIVAKSEGELDRDVFNSVDSRLEGAL
jgi:Na+/H+-dicarboxylate symporter